MCYIKLACQFSSANNISYRIVHRGWWVLHDGKQWNSSISESLSSTIYNGSCQNTSDT